MNNLKFSIITFNHKYQVLRQLLSTMNPTYKNIRLWLCVPVIKSGTCCVCMSKIGMTFIASVILRLHCFISSCYCFLGCCIAKCVYCLRENLIIFHYFMSVRCAVIFNTQSDTWTQSCRDDFFVSLVERRECDGEEWWTKVILFLSSFCKTVS